MVLHFHGQAFVRWIKGRTFGHSPGLEDPVMLEAKIIMKARGCVLLDDKARVFCGADSRPSARLSRLAEIALGLVRAQFLRCHPVQATS
jgi:hypothetical protein